MLVLSKLVSWSRVGGLLPLIGGLLAAVCSDGVTLAQGAAAPAKRLDVIFALDEEGTNWRPFFSLPQIGAHGSPSVSPDGRWLAFDGWLATEGESGSSSRMFVVSTKRDAVILLGNGSMPNFGPGAQQLAYSGGGTGVGIVTIATDEREVIDPQGWGAQWSPDGEVIAYTRGSQLWVYRLATKEKSLRYDGSGTYAQIQWNMGWSADSQRLTFLALPAENTGQRAIVTVTMDDKPVVVKEHFRGSGIHPKMAVHPTQPRIVFPMMCAERKLVQLYELNPETKTPPQLVEGQDATIRNDDPAWSVDGKTLFCTSGSY